MAFEITPAHADIFAAVESGERNLIISAVAGAGKCLGRGTPVMLADGRVIPVESVVAGDMLMGQDSKPRRVIKTNVGYGPLCRITPVKGTPWVCNDVHVMTLVQSVGGEVFDIPLCEWRDRSATRAMADAKLLRVGVDFPPTPALGLDPYLLGLWIGDGTTTAPSITNPDPEIVAYCQAIAPRYGSECVVDEHAERCQTIRFRMGTRGNAGRHTPHLLWHKLKSNQRDGVKFINNEFLVASREDRLALLAGLLDTDGYLGKGTYEIISVLKHLAEQYVFLARSLGLAAYMHSKTGTIKDRNFSGEYWRVGISGHTDIIPCKVARKIASPRKQKKDALRTGFSVEDIGDGEFFGFTLDGDGRFLLGDFTVTHNTSTIIEALKRIPTGNSILFLAFSKRIVEELVRRVPSNVSVMTLNAMGHQAITAHLRGMGIMAKLDADKVRHIASKTMEEREFRSYGSAAIKLCQLGKVNGIIPRGLDGFRAEGMTPDKIVAWTEIADFHDLEIGENVSMDDVCSAASMLLRKSCEQLEVIDFDDQLLLTYGMGAPLKTFDRVFTDESQDCSPLQHALIARTLKPETGRIIAVGDNFQSIFGFRGADSSSMATMTRTFQSQELPLHVSYRCPKSVVAMAQRYVDHIQAHEGAIDGTVIEKAQDVSTVDFLPGDMVICRYNAPVVKAAYSMLRRGIPCVVLGRDIGKGLQTLLRKLNATSLTDLDARLERWEQVETDKAKKKGNLNKQAAIADKAETLRVFIDVAEDMNDLMQRIESMFSDASTDSVVTCSSVHRSKGLEADRVFIVNFHKMPSKYAKQEWQVEQERNLIYVAVTRAKQHLQMVTVGDGRDTSKAPRPASTQSASVQDDMVPVLGKTYPVKDRLKKELNAQWNQDRKMWFVPKSKLDEANRIVRRGDR